MKTNIWIGDLNLSTSKVPKLFHYQNVYRRIIWPNEWSFVVWHWYCVDRRRIRQYLRSFRYSAHKWNDYFFFFTPDSCDHNIIPLFMSVTNHGLMIPVTWYHHQVTHSSWNRPIEHVQTLLWNRVTFHSFSSGFTFLCQGKWSKRNNGRSHLFVSRVLHQMKTNWLYLPNAFPPTSASP